MAAHRAPPMPCGRWPGRTNGTGKASEPGKLPPFIASLLPEGWLEAVLKARDERALLRTGKRYMSNVMIVERPSELAAGNPSPRS
jgi:serine/threonine-protein kinase HipA